MTDEERLRGAVKEALLLDGFLEGLTPEEAEAMVEKDYQETAKVLDEFKYAVETLQELTSTENLPKRLTHLPQFASIFRKIQRYFFRKLKHFKPWFLKTGCSAEKPLATVL